MFPVGRFDPDASPGPARKRQKKRGRGTSSRNPPGATSEHPRPPNGGGGRDHEKQNAGALRVIAEEQPDQTKLFQKSLLRASEEAFDDLDLLEELIEEPVHVQSLRDSRSGTTGIAASPAQNDEPEEEDDGDGDVDDDTRRSIQAAQRIAQLPIDEAAKGWNMAPFLVENLRRHNFEHFFPIQALAIPDVLASERHAHLRARDVCMTAPTGSGKTLAYVLPILNALAQNHTPRHGQHTLRALVVLPSRDLATQVYRVFEEYVVGSSFTVGLAIGQTDFAAEQKALTVDESTTSSDDVDMLMNRLKYDPGNLSLALQLSRLRRRQQHQPTTTTSAGTQFPNASHRMRVPANGWSNIDILVATPGRLVDHLDKTVGFTLQHLRFLVVDEADRLLSQSYHNWIDRVLDAATATSVPAWKRMMRDGYESGNDAKRESVVNTSGTSISPPFQLSANRQSVRMEPITWRRQNGSTNMGGSSTPAMVCRPIQLRKFLVSATLTRDPQKLAVLRLVNPKQFNFHSMKGNDKKYSMPSGLMEYVVECSAEQKPLVLLSLLLDQLQQQKQQQSRREKTIIAVFTASLDSTHRLARLLQLLWAANRYGDNAIGEFSSSLSQNQRAALLQRCNSVQDPLSVVVCSDGMSRGLDVDFVDTVINYDVPTLAKTYVHRCGRTARGSKNGTAITLLKGGQGSLFQRMRRLIQAPDRIKLWEVKKQLVRNAVRLYRPCMQALRDVLEAEENGELKHTDACDDYIPDPTL